MPGRRGVRACAARRVRKYDREVLRGSESLGWVGDGRSESSLEGAAHPLRMKCTSWACAGLALASRRRDAHRIRSCQPLLVHVGDDFRRSPARPGAVTGTAASETDAERQNQGQDRTTILLVQSTLHPRCEPPLKSRPWRRLG